MNVDPGELNKKIEIISKAEANSVSYDEDGYPIKTEDRVVRTCWASFKRTSGTEAVKANADFGSLRCRFLVRYTSTEITRKMKVRYNNTEYDITYVNDYEDRHEYIEIWCEVVSNE